MAFREPPISLKPRLGVEQPEEFEKLLEIYNRYPVSLLILHPRVRSALSPRPSMTFSMEGKALEKAWISETELRFPL